MPLGHYVHTLDEQQDLTRHYQPPHFPAIDCCRTADVCSAPPRSMMGRLRQTNVFYRTLSLANNILINVDIRSCTSRRHSKFYHKLENTLSAVAEQ